MNAGYSHSYDLVSKFYEGRSAARSGVPYMNHIDEGIVIMTEIGASVDAIGAYCLHPLVQSHVDYMDRLKPEDEYLDGVDPRQLMLAMDYRSRANAFLSYKIDRITDAEVATLNAYLWKTRDVRDMLIADKVQNYKDFLKYHLLTHERSEKLDKYFKTWLNDILDVYNYQSLVKLIEK